MVHVDNLNRTVAGQGNDWPTINIDCESVKGINWLIVAAHRSCQRQATSRVNTMS
jgi:hypothetical protein